MRAPWSRNTPAYHTNAEHYTQDERAIHHVDLGCPVGRRIRDDDRWLGTGLKPRCTRCRTEASGES